MRTLLRIMIVTVVVLSGLVAYLVVRNARRPGDALPELTVESIDQYRARADSLAAAADSVEREVIRSGVTNQPHIKADLDRLRTEITSLRGAIGSWERASRLEQRNQAYRECIRIYGRASGVCDALLTPDDMDDTDTGR